ncbi:hypothetical protein ABZ920_08880 [Streptomyces sp. NPDC046831]|uniref:hypothetical protein n=1 Tax=Streptomyces sp. NPDC046831 TaxID=3154805 RepID=UPI0033D91C53
MRIRGRGLRFTAVLAVTVLALTGFSRGHGHSGRHGGGSGGGCSSSRQDHDGSSSYGSGGGSGGSSGSGYAGSGDSYPTSDAGSGGSTADSDSTSGGGTGYGSTHRRPAHTPSASSSGHGSGLKDATVELLSCPTGTRPWAEAEVTNPNGREADFRVVVHFLDGASLPVDDGVTEVAVAAGGTRTAIIPFDVSRVSGYEHCEAVPRAEPVD